MVNYGILNQVNSPLYEILITKLISFFFAMLQIRCQGRLKKKENKPFLQNSFTSVFFKSILLQLLLM